MPRILSATLCQKNAARNLHATFCVIFFAVSSLMLRLVSYDIY